MIKQHERPKMLTGKALFVTHKLLDHWSLNQSSHGRNTEYKDARLSQIPARFVEITAKVEHF